MVDASAFPFVYGRTWPAVYITFVQITHQIKVLNEPLCRAQAIFMRCQTTSGVPNIVGLPTARSKTVRDSKGLPIARGKLVCEFDFHLTVSITIVRSIEKTQTTPKYPKPPQTSTKPHKPLPYTRNII